MLRGIPPLAYPIHWRLIYADGRTQDEHAEGQSILERRPYPIVLQLVDMRGVSVQSVNLPIGYLPVFYRQRSFVMDGSGAPRVDALVFGYGRETLENIDGKLWLWRGQSAVDCPQEHVAPGTLEWLLTSSPETTRMV